MPAKTLWWRPSAAVVTAVTVVALQMMMGTVVHAADDASLFLYLDAEENSPVIEFVDEGHGDFRSSRKPKVVEFYNPYCGACQAYKPTYVKLAKDLEEEMDDDMEIYAVSCEAHDDVCREYNIGDIPSVGIFPMGKVTPDTFRKLKVREKHPAYILPFLFPEQDKHKISGIHDPNLLIVPKFSGNGKPTKAEKMKAISRVLEEEEKADEGGQNGDDNAEDEEAGEEAGNEDEDGNGDETEEEENENNDNEDESGEEEENENNDNEDESEEEEEDIVAGAQKGEKADFGTDDGMNEENAEGDEEKTDDEEEKEEEEEEKNDDGDEGNEDEAGEEKDDDVKDESTDGDEQEQVEDHHPDDAEDPEWVQEANKDWFDGVGKEKPISDNLQRGGAAFGQKRPGAAMKADVASDMNRFKEALLQGKTSGWQKFFGKESLGDVIDLAKKMNTGGSMAMKAHTPGTPEYEARQKKMNEHLEKLMKKKGLRTASTEKTTPKVFSAGAGGVSKFEIPRGHKPVLSYKKEVQPHKLVHKIVDKIPIVKRLARLSKEEELILDASLSFVASLKLGLFSSSDQLTKAKKAALQSWLDLLRVALPPEWGLHELIMDLDNNIDLISLRHENLEKLLKKHDLPRKKWSHSCSYDGKQRSFNCGFWKLMHVVTVGIAEHRGGLNLVEGDVVSKHVRIFSPNEAADVMKDFIAQFFPCTPCKDHFVAQYDQCSNRRCVRLTDATEEASNADWMELAKWLWEVHNDVNVRLLGERSRKKVTVHDEVRVLYPPLHDCQSCLNADGVFDEDAVFLYLEKEYWPGSSEIDAQNDNLFKFHNVEEEAFAYFWAFAVIGVWLVYLFRPRLCGVVSKRPKKRAD